MMGVVMGEESRMLVGQTWANHCRLGLRMKVSVTHTHITNEQSLPKNVSTTYGWTLAHHTMNSTGVSSFRKYGGQFVYSISGEVLGSEPGGSFDTPRVSRRV